MRESSRCVPYLVDCAGGWDVYVGTDLSNFDQKFALYQSISEQLAGQGITPALISVEFVNAPYYRLEK